MYKVNNTGPSTGPYGTPYESVTLGVSSFWSHHPQEVLLAQFSLYFFVHKGGLKPHSFHFIRIVTNDRRYHEYYTNKKK